MEILEHCDNCANTGWVCEEHSDKPWSGAMPSDYIRCCGGAGMPCGVCNAGSSYDHPPDTSRLYKTVETEREKKKNN